MDPNANLKEQLLLSRLLSSGLNEETFYADAERLAELIEALDNWITKGGFLPDRWRKSK